MSVIFICYRRGDSAGFAGWLHKDLHRHFGDDGLFMDINTIEIGADFVKVVENAVGSCDVLLALIGPQWVSSVDPSGHRRLDDPEDYVRLEIETALSRNIRVIPVLLQGASMPRPDELPDPLKALTRRQAFYLSDTRSQADVDRLVKEIVRLLPPRDKNNSRPSWQRISIITSMIIISITIAMLAFQYVSSSRSPIPSPPVKGVVIIDCQDSVEQYRKDAEQGNTSAQYELGTIYEHGRCDISKDLDEAKRWYLKATAQGDAAADEAYKRLIGK